MLQCFISLEVREEHVSEIFVTLPVALTLVMSFHDPIHDPRLKLTKLSEEGQWMLENSRLR